MSTRAWIGLLIVTIAAAVSNAQTCGWEWVNPTPPRTDIYRLKHETNAFVGVGASGTIIRSGDGFSWDLVPSGVEGDLFGIDWGAGAFVAVGQGVVIRSSGGFEWETVYENPDVTLLDVEFSASRFIAVGEGLDGHVLSSSFGLDWVVIEVPWTGVPDSIAGSDDGFYVAVGTEIWFSPTGYDWEYQGSAPASPVKSARLSSSKKTGMDLFELDRIDLAWAGSRLLWAGGSELWSREGADKWQHVMELDGCPPYSDWLGLSAGSGWAMASGVSGCPTPYLDPTVTLTISVDGGVTFRQPFETEGGGFPGLARYGARWVAAGALGDVMTSSNGSTWACDSGSCSALGCEDGLVDLAAGEDRWVAVGGVGLCDGHLKRSSGGTTATSADGSTWQIHALAGQRFRGVAWGETSFLAVGDGWLARSDNGADWTTENAPEGRNLSSAVSGDGWEVVVGQLGALYVSENQHTWLKPFLFVNEDFDRVVWDGELYFALGHEGTILRSEDALNWEEALAATTANLHGAALGPDSRIIVGDGGAVLASTDDGRTWLPRRSGVDSALRDVTYAQGRFMAVGWDDHPDGSQPAVVLASTDGVQWTKFFPPGEALRRVRWTGDAWIAVGGERTILRTECLGTIIDTEEEHLQIPFGETTDLHLRLSLPVTEDTLLTVSSSHPGRAAAPASVTVMAASDTARIPVTGLALVSEAVLTLSLPDDLGGGATTVLVTVQPPEWTPRNPSGRVTP
jgi:hypothetical protein